MLIKIGNAFVDPAEITAVKEADVDVYGEDHIEIALRQNPELLYIAASMAEAEAALINAGVIEYDGSEEDAPELTEAELDIAKALYEDGLSFLARDKNGQLFAFRAEPSKDGAYWNPGGNEKPQRVEEGFDFISFEDDNPWDIQYLLIG